MKSLLHEEPADVPEVLLVFPPLTESRLFPYLSLPMLAAYLRANGVSVRSLDWNIDLCHRLFTPELLARFIAKKESSSERLHDVFRLEMARYLLQEQPRLARSVFGRTSATHGATEDVRLVRQGVELLLEGSELKFEPASLEELAGRASNGATSGEDPGLELMEDLFDRALARGAPAVFGISVAFFSQLLPCLLLAKRLKERHPETLVVIGGQQIMLHHEALVTLDAVRRHVDCLCIGAGEEALLDLARVTRGQGERAFVPNVVWLSSPSSPRLSSNVHIRELPPPDFTDFPISSYLTSYTELAVVTCFGCFWGRCIFCSYGNRSRREGYQQKSALQIADECQAIVERHGVKRINFVDENTNLKLVVQAMEILGRRGTSIEFSTRNRLEPVLRSREFCQELRSRGCVLMSVGFETSSQRLLDLLDKGVEAADYQTIVDNLHDVGIPLRLSVMGGILDETEEEVAASERFLVENADKIGIDVMQMLVCEPGTRLAESSERYGIRLRKNGALRGNRVLSYGMGRMGNAFDFVDGDTFDGRLQRFLRLYGTVRPQKNDEVAPARRAAPREHAASGARVSSLALHPWVRVVSARLREDAPPARVVVDLLWQTFHRLPDAVTQIGSTLRMSVAAAGDPLARLAAAGTGTASIARDP